jgi:hypothetical protein
MRSMFLVALAVGALALAGVSSSVPAAAAAASDPTGAMVTVAVAAPESLPLPPSQRFVQRIDICPSKGCTDPPSPICAGDSVRVTISGAFPNACFRPTGADLFYPPFMGARLTAPWVRLLYEDRTCLGPCATVLVGFRFTVTLPPLPPGMHDLTVVQQPSGCDTVPLPLAPMTFAVVDSCDTLPPPPNTLPYVERVTICPNQPSRDPACGPICPGDSIAVLLSGSFPSDCYSLKRVEIVPMLPTVIGPPTLRVVVDNGCCLGRPCAVGPKPWNAIVMLPPLPGGSYALSATLAELCCSDVVPPMPTPGRRFPFVVSSDCVVPPPNSLPYVDLLTICPNQASPDPCGPICRDDSIAVLIAGAFPNDCYVLKRVDVLPPPPSFREAAPQLRVVVDSRCCLDRVCLPNPTRWHTVVKLPPMSPGPYDLTVRVAEVCCSDELPPDPLPSAHHPFAVVDSCPGEACLWGRWMHAGDEPNSCDAYIAPGAPATVTFGIQSAVPLAALQGEFRLSWPVPAFGSPPATPVVTRVVPVGPAAGMQVAWVRDTTTGNVKFAMFAKDGAPIPASPPFARRPPVPILAVAVAVLPGEVPPADIAVFAYDLFGSDAAGAGVPTCAVRDNWRMALDRARICSGTACDFNRDGRADVRDLVVMVRCLRSDTCANPARFDCDRDGGFDLDDVLCCAWQVLRRPPCPGCAPDMTPPRKEPGVQLVLGSPAIVEGEVLAPISIAGAGVVGGARLELRFPSDRYEFVSLEGVGTDWLALTEARGDAIVIGLIRLAETEDVYSARALSVGGTLRLRLRPGMAPGGELAASSAEFSGTDGSRLETGPGGGTMPLSEGLDFALSDNRPDPFSGVTRFTLTLPVAAEADLGVFDVGGRRVTTLHRGRLAAGVNEFAWNGRAGDGGRVANGVYFYRATVAGRTASKKLVVLNE